MVCVYFPATLEGAGEKQTVHADVHAQVNV